MRKYYPVLFFLAVTALAFWKVIFHSEFTMLSGDDICNQSYPWLNVAAFWLKKGIFLLWDPYVYSGKPNLGELQTGILYPLNWVFMLLPARGGGINLDGMEALFILHYFLAGLFCYWMARSFNLTPHGAAVAGIAFALGGYTTQVYAYMNVFYGFVWMPLVWLLFRRALLAEHWRTRYSFALWSGFCLALSFLAGHHVPPVHTCLLLLFYTAFLFLRDWKQATWSDRLRNLQTLALIPVTMVLITALQWLPSAEWARLVYRWLGDGEPVQWGQRIPYSILQSSGNLSPQDVLSMLLPYISTGVNIYVGPFVLFFSLVGILFVRHREVWFFSSMAFLYLFFGLGQFSSLHGWANTFIPGVWFARGVDHYLIPFQLSLALLAGWGLDSLVASYSSSLDPIFRTFIRKAGWAIALMVVFSGILMALLALLKNMPIDHPYLTRVGSAALYLAILGFLLYLLHIGRIQPSRFAVLSIVVVLVDLSSHISADFRVKTLARGQDNPAVQTYWKKSPAAEFLSSQRQREYFRVDDASEVFPSNFGDAWRLEETMGHGATALVKYVDFRGIGWGPASNASALLSARYFLSRIPIPGMKKVFEEGDSVYLNPRAVPRAFAVARYRSFSNDSEMLRWIQSPLLSPRDTVFIRERDLHTLPAAFLSGERNERDGVQVQIVSNWSSAERKAASVTDAEERRKLYVFQAPWGWSVGDEATIVIRPDNPVANCYLILNYYPEGLRASRLTIRMEGPSGPAQLRVELPVFEDPAREDDELREAVVNLGPLQDRAYQLSFVKTEECSVRIDSIRISKSIPDPEERNLGSVRIASFKPNRLILRAALRRPAFVVVSELFYPGWEAWIDGRPAPLLEGDYLLRVVAVPQGEHEIVLRFRSKTFQWGLVISLISFGGMIAFLVANRRR